MRILLTFGGFALIALATASCSDAEPKPVPTSAPSSGGPTVAAPRTTQPTSAPIREDERYGGVLKIAQPGDPVSCDLAMSRGVGYQSVHPCNTMLSQIVMFDASDHGNIVSDLATGWELSVDGLNWEFDIRDDARWHDGSDVTANDLEFTLDRVINPPDELAVGRAGTVTGYVSSATQTNVVGLHTLRVSTDFPAASFLANLASVYVSAYPETATTALDSPTMTLPEQVVGSGPFKYAESIRGSFYRFTRNDDYYEPALPYLDGVTYLVMPSSAVRLAALQAGEVDILMLITEPEAEALASSASDIRVIRDPSAGGNTVQMNMSVPPFDDPKVRLAINLAFDRDAAQVALGGGFDGAIMPPGGPWMLDGSAVDALPGYGDKVAERAEARALLAEAGFEDGLETKMHTRSDPFSSSLAEFAAAQLSVIGVDVEIVAMERTAYQDFLLRGEHGLISHSHSFALDDPDAILPAHYSCAGSENYPGLCDDEIDRMISEQSKLLDDDARLALVAEIQSRIWAENGKIWFNWSVRRTPVWQHVNNFDPGGPSLYQGRRLDTVWLAR